MLNTIVPIFSAGAAVATSFESIATVTVGSGGASSVEFTSIATDWKHLQIRYIGKDDTDSIYDGNLISLQFNSDTGNNYKAHDLTGNGSSASAGVWGDTYRGIAGTVTDDSASFANMYGVGIIDILDYANTNKNKTVRVLTGADTNGAGSVALRSIGWFSTSAITSIKLFIDGSTFKQYSHFALYGIKSA